MKRIFNWILLHKEWFMLGFIVLLSGFIHGYSMLQYPYFENDEATYLAQAWSFLSEGKLAPYTYGYDHAPLGWVFTSLWLFLTGGLFTFGFSLNSARIFMLVIHIISTFLLYKISKKITGTNLSAFITCLFFAVSPLAVYFQRRFLLDNIMTFWLFASLFLILYSKDRLWLYFVSALAFGIAVLTKENAIFFMPVFIGLVASNAHKHHKVITIVKWVIIAGMVVSLYPLYALLKKELFPAGSLFSPPGEHVSLLGALVLQSSRGANLPFWSQGSDFITNLSYWFGRDQFFVILGFIFFFVVMFQALSNKISRVIFLLTLSIMAFLASGKLVINFYVIPLIPFLALCIGYVMDQQFKQIKRFNKFLYLPVILLFLGIFSYYYSNSNNLKIALMTDETTNQKKALEWVKKNVEPTKFIAIDYYGNLDFRNSRFSGDPVFKNADWFWKLQFDPEIKINKLKNDSRNIDYILLTAEMYRSIIALPDNQSLILKALKNSSLVYFASDDLESELVLPTYPKSHPNGNWVAVYKQNTFDENLMSSWKFYKETFISDSGIAGDSLSSELSAKNQSMALLRSAMVMDRITFDKVLNWTQKNMLLTDKNLFVTSIDTLNTENLNQGTTTESDQNIALSLIIAYKNWNDPKYLNLAKEIIADIWTHETVSIKNKRYIVAGDWTSNQKSEKFTVNTSYLSPLTYKIFSTFDKKNNWQQLADTSYEILNACSSSKLGLRVNVFLPPSWCDIRKDGTIISSLNIGKKSSDYSSDTAKIFMNLSLDYEINKDVRATDYFNKLNFLVGKWKNEKKVYTAYTHAGTKAADNESTSHYAALLAYASVTDKKMADQIYNQKIISQAVVSKSGYYWGDKGSSNEQYLAWLATLIYFNKIPESLKN